VGVPVVVIASCAIALLRVPEVTNMLSLTNPRMQPVVVAAVDLSKSGPAPAAPSVPPEVEVEPYGADGVPDRPTLSVKEQPLSVALRSPTTVELAQALRPVATKDSKRTPLDEVKAAGQQIGTVITASDASARNTVVAQDAGSDEIKPSAGARRNDVVTVASSDQSASGQPRLDAEFRREGAPVIEPVEITGPRPVPLTKIADLPSVESHLATSIEEEHHTAVDNAVRSRRNSGRKASTVKRRGHPKARTVDATQVDPYSEFDSYRRHHRRHHLSAMR
jgi:hypothetical protein